MAMNTNRYHQDQDLITAELEMLEWLERKVPPELRLKAQMVVLHRRQQLSYEQAELLLLLPELEEAAERALPAAANRQQVAARL